LLGTYQDTKGKGTQMYLYDTPTPVLLTRVHLPCLRYRRFLYLHTYCRSLAPIINEKVFLEEGTVWYSVLQRQSTVDSKRGLCEALLLFLATQTATDEDDLPCGEE